MGLGKLLKIKTKYFSRKLSKNTQVIGKSVYKNTTDLSAIILAFLADTRLLRELGKLTKTTATDYSKAMDAVYLKTKIGGGDHRLFDGGHTLLGAWRAVKDASPDDSFGEEVVAFISELWKDGTTVKGLPFFTLNKDGLKDAVEQISEKLSAIPGIKITQGKISKYLKDLGSFDAFEILSIVLSVLGVIFAFKKNDQKKLAELLGNMGIISIISANPVMGIIAVACGGYAYFVKKIEFDKKSMSKSVIMTGTSLGLLSLINMSILIEIVIIGVLAKVFRQKILDNDSLLELIKERVLNTSKDKLEVLYKCIQEIKPKHRLSLLWQKLKPNFLNRFVEKSAS